MNGFFSWLKGWFGQTSTKAALTTVGITGGMVAAGVLSPTAAIPLAVPALIGLAISDKATAAQVAASVQPALQAVAAHPTMDVAKAQAAGVAAAMLPKIESKLPADAQTALAAATIIAQAAAAKPS
jgi:hypothetical protein